MKEPPDPHLSGLHSRGVLPHLKRDGATYFITFREAGSLPKGKLAQLKAEREAVIAQARAANHPLTWTEEKELFKWYSERVDRHLDEGHGVCYLRDAKRAKLVAEAIRHFDRERYELRAWVVMPNHAHAVVRPKTPYTLGEILHSWKSYTSHELQKVLPIKVVPFWQNESYDHLIRDDDDLYYLCRYTIMNPVNARLCARPEDWTWSSASASSASSAAVPAAGSGTVPVQESMCQARIEKSASPVACQSSTHKSPSGTLGKPAGEDARAT
jgi:REP element-mobilizing transposase RayT